MLNANWLGAPRLCTLRTIGARGIKTWRAFGASSYFLTGKSRLQHKFSKFWTTLVTNLWQLAIHCDSAIGNCLSLFQWLAIVSYSLSDWQLPLDSLAIATQFMALN